VRVLVFGGNGFLGKYVCEELSQKSAKVYACMRNREQKGKVPVHMEQIFVDVRTDFEAFLPKEEIDVVYYLAQSSRFREFPEGVEDIYGVNVQGLYKALKWAIDNSVKKFIYASTGGLYPQSSNAGSHEDDVVPLNRPLNFYLYSKTCGEALVQGFAPLFQSTVICRPFFIYGPGQRRDMLIPKMIDSVRNGKSILLKGPEGILLNPIYVEDAAHAFVKASELLEHWIFNIAGPEVISLKQLCNIIAEIVQKEPVFEMDQNEEPETFVADIKLMCKHLISPSFGIKAGLQKTIIENRILE
jgi:UDP-glucose 4-epimerase